MDPSLSSILYLWKWRLMEVKEVAQDASFSLEIHNHNNSFALRYIDCLPENCKTFYLYCLMHSKFFDWGNCEKRRSNFLCLFDPCVTEQRCNPTPLSPSLSLTMTDWLEMAASPCHSPLIHLLNHANPLDFLWRKCRFQVLCIVNLIFFLVSSQRRLYKRGQRSLFPTFIATSQATRIHSYIFENGYKALLWQASLLKWW